MTNELHSTTFKVEPAIGNGIRIMAAVNGDSIADLAQQAVSRILSYHNKPAAKSMPTSTRSERGGRPGATLQQAASAVLRSRPDKNESLPTRIPAKAARALARLADELGTKMNHLAEQGAKHLLQEGPEIAKAIAMMSGDEAYERAIDAVQKVAQGDLSEDEFRTFDVIGANAGAKASLKRRRTKKD